MTDDQMIPRNVTLTPAQVQRIEETQQQQHLASFSAALRFILDRAPYVNCSIEKDCTAHGNTK